MTSEEDMMKGEDLPNEEITKNSTNPPELLTTADFEHTWDLEHLRPVHEKIPYPEMAGVTINTLDDFKPFLGRFVVVQSNAFDICREDGQVYGYLSTELATYSDFLRHTGWFNGYGLSRLFPVETTHSSSILDPLRKFKISIPTPEQYEEILEKLRSGWKFEYPHHSFGADKVNAQRMKLN